MPRIDLALQGGGSHGAFTWGVLDALLEDGRLDFDGVSGTSAGAMNAAVLASGYARGGREGARQALREFWREISGTPGCLGGAQSFGVPVAAAATASASAGVAAPFAWPGASPFASQGLAMPMWPAWMFNLDQWPLYSLFDSFWRSLSPYQFNPLNLNPLRTLLERHVDLAALRSGPLRVFVTATAVSTGQPHVFSAHQLSVDALLASACLPQLFQSVQIAGELGPDGQPESFWDGGFAGNPAIWPLIYDTGASDVLLVQINPLVRTGVPRTAADIADRVNEITFNASLVAEMRAIAFVKKLIKQGKLDLADYKHLHVHRIADEEGLAPFDASSKSNTDPRLLQQLFELGRAAATRWLVEHLADVGRCSSTDIAPVYLEPRGKG
ncbi:MAG: patatin-like phospholipase family protein [Leptothrix sp. (in: b-proteobacteria)]